MHKETTWKVRQHADHDVNMYLIIRQIAFLHISSSRAVPDFAGSPILPISEWQISAPIRYRRHFFFPDTVPDKPSALPISYRQISADIGETGKEDEIKCQNKGTEPEA